MSTDQIRTSLELLLTISRELATTLDLKEALSKVILLSMQNVRAERGSLIALGEAGEPMEAAIFAGGRLVPHTVEQLRLILANGLAGWVLKAQQPVWLPDTTKDDRWLRRPDDALEQTGAKSAICLPLQARDQLVGVLTIVHPQPNFFNEEQFVLLQAIADLAGMAIHNAILYASLQSSNQRYQELFEDSIDPIFITDWQGSILELNRQASVCVDGATHQEPRAIQDIHTINWEAVGQNFEELRAGKIANYEAEMQCGNNKLVPVEIHVRSALINDQNVLQWIVRDVSERKALDSLREDLMAMIYHDLRSPLANIVSSLDILNVLLPADDSSIQPVYQIAVRSTERMQRLINSLLDIKRLEAGQPITNLKPVEVDLLIREAIEIVQPISSSKRQMINGHFSGHLPSLSADEGMLKRVLVNLLENAIKFTPLDGAIEVGSLAEDGNMLLWVADSGPGIPDEARDRIFNKFTRLQAQQFPKGIGLGLAFCKLAVSAHGGKIWVDSELGSGSRFNILLPLSPENSPHP